MVMLRRKDKKATQERTPSGDPPSPPLLEPLLGVHSALNTGWLADAASTAAERGLGALYGLLFLLDSSGQLYGERPASSERMRALAKLNQLLGTNATALRFAPQDRPAVSTALREGRAQAIAELGEALPLQLEAGKLRSVQRRLGVSEVWLAPLHWNNESTGLLVLLMPASPAAPLALAELLGRHAAVALKNLREREAGRRRGELDAVRWVYDEQRFQEQLGREIQRAQRHKRSLSVLLLRVENYQDLRSRFGRFLAERALRQVAGAVEDAMRTTDFLGAFNVDGFAAILVEADATAAERARERLSSALAEVKPPTPDLQLQLAYATATLSDDGATAEELTAAAEARLGETLQEDVA